MNVVLAAEESAGMQVLRAIARSRHKVVGVLTSPAEPGATGVSVWKVAQDLGLETWPAKLVKDPALAGRLRSQQVDILLNVHSLHIIQEDVLAAPKLGAFNLHPGPLPRYAGLNAVSWALYRGEKTHGVTIHKMESKIDTGPIAYQSVFPIAEDETALSLSFKCIRHGVTLMLKLLEAAASDPGKIPLQPQDLSQREYFGRQIPQDGQLSWRTPAERIVNFVRACDFFPFHSPWGHPRARFGDQEIAVVKAQRIGLAADAPPGTVAEPVSCGVPVACLDEWVLVKRLKVNGTFVEAKEILKSGTAWARQSRV
jgi:methionyl-tRNA formyltransferase